MNEFYTQQMVDMKNDIDNMIKKLKKLWKSLNYNVDDLMKKYEKFLNKCTQTTYDIIYQELQRCEKERIENLKSVIDNLRVDIYEWWEKCLKSDIERKRFINFTNDCYTEDLLELHEIELEELKAFYEDNK